MSWKKITAIVGSGLILTTGLAVADVVYGFSDKFRQRRSKTISAFLQPRPTR
jgi:hypothetical protein